MNNENSKEYHINISCETYLPEHKMIISQAKRTMKDFGADLVSQLESLDDTKDLFFHNYTSMFNAIKSCEKFFDSIKNINSPVSLIAYEHNPRVSIDISDVLDRTQFDSFLKTLATTNNAKAIEDNSENPNLVSVSFERSADRQNFQHEYSATASAQMKNGMSSVNVYPDWDDVSIFNKDNYKSKPSASI